MDQLPLLPYAIALGILVLTAIITAIIALSRI